MAPSLSLLTLALAGTAQGARFSRKHEADQKSLAGVPIHNYNRAYGGMPRRAAQEEHWIVMVKPETTDDEVSTFCHSSEAVCERMGHPSQAGVPYFEVYGTEEQLQQILEVAAGKAEFVEPDMRVAAIPELEERARDMVAETSWGLTRVGNPEKDTYGRGTHIYVFDTGVRISHRDFSGRAIGALDVSNGRPIACNGNLNCAGDGHGHGTHCAGTAAGDTFGIATDALIYGVKVLGDDGFGDLSYSLDGLDWLAQRRITPAIASMSLGGDGVMQSYEPAIDAVVSRGVTVVVAAGNLDKDACSYSPAYVPAAIAVGSTTNFDHRSDFSSWGECVNIWAPGSNIWSAGIDSDTSRDIMSGTSMATPHVSGGAALLLGQNPELTAAQVLQRLLDRAEVDAISRLEPGDTNKLLWVGANPAPAPAPTPAPEQLCHESARYPMPDSAGDCMCRERWLCVRNGQYFRCPTSGGPGAFGGRYFLHTCTDCICQNMLR